MISRKTLLRVGLPELAVQVGAVGWWFLIRDDAQLANDVEERRVAGGQQGSGGAGDTSDPDYDVHIHERGREL